MRHRFRITFSSFVIAFCSLCIIAIMGLFSAQLLSLGALSTNSSLSEDSPSLSQASLSNEAKQNAQDSIKFPLESLDVKENRFSFILPEGSASTGNEQATSPKLSPQEEKKQDQQDTAVSLSKKRYTLRKVETFPSLLEELHLNKEEESNLLTLLKETPPSPHSSIEVSFNTLKTPDDKGYIQEVFYRSSEEETTTIKKNEEAYAIEKEPLAITSKIFKKEGEIENTLYGTLLKQGVPETVILQFIAAFKDKNLNRLAPKTPYRLLFNAKVNADNRIIEMGNLIHAELTLKGKTYERYRIVSQSGNLIGYYDSSITKASAKTTSKFSFNRPVKGSYRVSSGYGLRVHPISKRRKMHWGVDYAGNYGHPVYAPSSGTVSYLGRYKGYGRHIRIKHSNKYETSYSHLNGYAKKLKVGQKVTKGQLIGYIGSSGYSTGPHLHWEAKKNGKRINPASLLKLKTTKTVETNQAAKKQFIKRKKTVDIWREALKKSDEIEL